jgi:23S rRNA (uracil1939-C5)-methyltransferase
MTQGISVTKLTTDGRGLAFIDGKATFIKGALPGEEVTLHYLKRKRQYDEAVVLEILKPAPERVVPQCQVFGICGGCSLQHLQSQAQIHYKEMWLRELLAKADLTTNSWLAPLQAEVWGYRHKARLGVRFVKKKQEVLVGFREAESNFITNTQRCEILHPHIGAHLQELKQMLTTLSSKDQIAQIELAVSDVGVALVFRHLVPLSATDVQKIIALAKNYPWFIYLQSGGLETIEQIYPEQPVALTYTLNLLQNRSFKFIFRPQDFIQVNRSLNEKMLEQALFLLELTAEDRVADLFCGLGNFSLPIAALSKEVLGLEGDAAMTRLAQDNAEANQITNVRFASSNLFDVDAFTPWALPVDKLLLDPPRAGAEAVVRHMHLWRPRRLVYVSCHLATLVRDLEILVKEQGYKLQALGVMDMFPHTDHVEAMALLTH